MSAVLGLGTAIVLVATACTGTVRGTAVTAAGPPPGTVDVSLLDTGNYPTSPSPPMGLAGPVEQGALIESQRMANYVTGPWEVDPTMVHQSLDSAVMLWKLSTVGFVLGERNGEIAGRHHFVAGFFSVRGDEQGNSTLNNAALRFESAADAELAAKEFSTVLVGAQPGDPEPVPVQIPGHPDTHAVSGSRVEYIDGAKNVVSAFTSHGPYVLAQIASARDSAGLENLVARTLDLQIPLIDTFVPTEVAQLADLPIDPTGLLAKTLPVAPSDALPLQRTVYEVRGALHLSSDPGTTASQYRDAEMTHMAYADATVTETGTSDGAQRLAATFFSGPIVLDVKPVAAVPHLPASRCAELTLKLAAGPRAVFSCVVTVDRYVAEVSSPQLRDVHHKAAAQYAMLTAP